MWTDEDRAWNFRNAYQWKQHEGDRGCAHIIAFADRRYQRVKR